MTSSPPARVHAAANGSVLSLERDPRPADPTGAQQLDWKEEDGLD